MVVVGAGVSGLATAYYLRTLTTNANLQVTVFEESPRPGGKVQTVQCDGFVVEAGPDSFFNPKPDAIQLCRAIGLGDQLIDSNDEHYETRVWFRGRLWPLPRGFRMGIPTRIWPFLTTPLLSPFAKARMALDLVLPARSSESDESVGAFLSRRLGREVVERMAGPILGAIYAGDPYQMSAHMILPQLVELERRHRSLTLGLQAARRHRGNGHSSAPASVFSTLRPGMAALPERLAQKLGPDLRLSTRVEFLAPRDGRWQIITNGQAWTADAVVLAVPAQVAAKLVATWSREAAAELGRFPVSSSAVVALAFQDADIPELLRRRPVGVVVALTERAQLLALTWSSAKFAERAPTGWHLLRAFIGGPLQEELARRDPTELLNCTLAELRRMLGLHAQPRRVWIYSWPGANPQMNVGHLDRIARIERLLSSHPGIFLTGSAFRGIGLADCVRSARATAQAVLTYLGQTVQRR
jgi:oxygen-dependent protoporphyrinogen oxidase